MATNSNKTTTRKKSPAKKSTGRKKASKKKAAKKTAAKKSPTKKAATKKKAAKKSPTKAATAKKAAKKSPTKAATAKKAAKKSPTKAATAKKAAKKTSTKAATAKKVTKKSLTKKKASAEKEIRPQGLAERDRNPVEAPATTRVEPTHAELRSDSPSRPRRSPSTPRFTVVERVPELPAPSPLVAADQPAPRVAASAAPEASPMPKPAPAMDASPETTSAPDNGDRAEAAEAAPTVIAAHPRQTEGTKGEEVNATSNSLRFPTETGITLGFLEDLASHLEASPQQSEPETAIAEQQGAGAAAPDSGQDREDDATTLERLMAEEAVNTPHEDVEDDPDAVPWTPPSRAAGPSTMMMLADEEEPKGFLARLWYRLRRLLDLQ